MYGGIAETIVSLPTHEAATQAATVLMAKSEADMLLDDFFGAFPLMVVGALFGYAALQTGKKVLEVEIPENAEIPVSIVAALGGAAFLVLASNAGILNAISGITAKTALDAWNVFANTALKGAILKY
jgi:hypothetical protein